MACADGLYSFAAPRLGMGGLGTRVVRIQRSSCCGKWEGSVGLAGRIGGSQRCNHFRPKTPLRARFNEVLGAQLNTVEGLIAVAGWDQKASNSSRAAVSALRARRGAENRKANRLEHRFNINTITELTPELTADIVPDEYGCVASLHEQVPAIPSRNCLLPGAAAAHAFQLHPWQRDRGLVRQGSPFYQSRLVITVSRSP
jgi:hypothetical protein